MTGPDLRKFLLARGIAGVGYFLILLCAIPAGICLSAIALIWKRMGQAGQALK